MAGVEIAFFSIALIIVSGYLGMLFFNKTKIPEIILLLFLGLILGPILGLVSESGLAIFQSILPFFATFALIVILFEGGLHLNFFKMLKSISNAFVFTIIVFIFTMIVSFVVIYGMSFFGLLNFDILTSLMLGAILGGTSSAIVIPLVNSTNAKDETKMLLNLESALTDALCVIIAVAIGELIIINSLNVTNVASSILAAFSVAAVVGGLFGLLWLKVLSYLQQKPYEYLMTLAALLFLFSVVSTFKGNGAIAALTFGLVLGNSEDITGMLRITSRTIDGNIKNFQREISFLVRTLFFVYLGILFKIEYLTIPVIVASIILVLLYLGARYAGAKIIAKFSPIFKGESTILSTMMSRGLAAAVLVSLPISMGINLPESTTNQITAIAFIVILLTNVITTVGVFLAEQEYKKKATSSPGEKVIITTDMPKKTKQ